MAGSTKRRGRPERSGRGQNSARGLQIRRARRPPQKHTAMAVWGCCCYCCTLVRPGGGVAARPRALMAVGARLRCGGSPSRASTGPPRRRLTCASRAYDHGGGMATRSRTHVNAGARLRKAVVVAVARQPMSPPVRGGGGSPALAMASRLGS